MATTKTMEAEDWVWQLQTDQVVASGCFSEYLRRPIRGGGVVAKVIGSRRGSGDLFMLKNCLCLLYSAKRETGGSFTARGSSSSGGRGTPQ